MESIYNLARGTARIEISGAEPEKMLNLCAEKGIEFWDADPNENFLIAVTVHAADYPAIRERSSRCGCTVKLVSSRGGKNFTKKVRGRLALVLSIVLCISLLAASSMFVWAFDITGNEKLSDGRILRALSQCGVDYGVYWPDLSSDAVRSQMQLLLPEIGWMSINIHNSRAQIKIRERVAKPDIVQEKQPQEIAAGKSGIITKMSVLEGKALVSTGDTVVCGDTLVSALMDSETGEDRLVHAMAEVEARTWYELSAVTPLFESVKTEKHGAATDFSLIIGKNPINFFGDSRNTMASCGKMIRYESASFGGAFTLPVGYMSSKSRGYETEVRHIDENAAEERLRQTLMLKLQSEVDGEIVSYTYSVSCTDELMTVTLRAECLENIAVGVNR